jgi:CheY-like chemotaxis protein
MKQNLFYKYLLYAEDDPDDQHLFNEAMQSIDDAIQIKIVSNGLLLLQYLNDLSPGHPLPSCIVLDINMPVWDGIQALQAIKADEKFKGIPVCILTTSSSQKEQQLCAELGIDAFFTKPLKRDEMLMIGRKIAQLCSEVEQKTTNSRF